MEKLFDNMLNHITELVNGVDLYDTLSAIGFTYDEMIECEVELDEENADDYDIGQCPKCKCFMFQDECETDKYWDDEGNHILIIKCPYCDSWFENK